MSVNRPAKFWGVPTTARWRIVGWILLTTALMMLTFLLGARSIFIRQVHMDANMAIIQEVHEFNAFANDAVNPRTHRPFASLTELMEHYLMRQTPDRGEAFIAVTPDDVLLVDNAANDAGERLSANRTQLGALLKSLQPSGVENTPDGELRWGKSVIEGRNGERGVLLVAQFVQSNIHAVHRRVLVWFGVLLGGLLLTAAVAWLVAGQILAPVQQFARLSDRIDSFNLKTRLPEENNNELGQLARSVNNMLDRLDSAHAEQKHVLYEVVRQVQNQIRDLSRLRKPLVGTPTQAAVLDGSLADMRRLVQDLELLLESGSPGFLHYQNVRLDKLAGELAEQLNRLYPAHRWQVVGTSDITAPMDRQCVLLAMQHLARNADEHHPVGQAILLGVSTRRLAGGEEMASLWIANQGIPLNQEEIQAVFEPAGGRGQAVSDGPRMGMGLAVVKALAHAHGGYAWAESDTGCGTVFGMDIPLVRPAGAAREGQMQKEAGQALSSRQ